MSRQAVEPGHLERAHCLGVAGWLQRGARRTVRIDGVAIGEVLADEDRADLRARDAAGFAAWFARPLPDGAEIEVEGPPPIRLATPPRSPWRADRDAPLALFVDAALPVAGRDAGANAALSHVRSLGRLGFRVLLAGPAELPATLKAEAGRVRLVILHRLDSMGWVRAVRAAAPGVRVAFSVADLHGVRATRRTAVTGVATPPNLVAAELAACHLADLVLTHSAAEADWLATKGFASATVPWHVPLRPAPATAARGAAVTLLGNFAHAPNEDAARWLLEFVMPVAWRTRPALPVIVAGRAMPTWLTARADARVRAWRDVADLPALWAETRLCVAPLRFGAGLKGKVLDSLAAGIPCLCTPIAAEGFPDGLLPVAPAEPAPFARALVALHDHAARAAAIARHGQRHVASACAEPAVDQALASALGIIAPGRLGPLA